jgi:hypothetical protein
VTGPAFNIAVAFENGPRGGRAIAQSTLHHFADHNWDVRAGSPSFVTDPRRWTDQEPREQSLTPDATFQCDGHARPWVRALVIKLQASASRSVCPIPCAQVRLSATAYDAGTQPGSKSCPATRLICAPPAANTRSRRASIPAYTCAPSVRITTRPSTFCSAARAALTSREDLAAWRALDQRRRGHLARLACHSRSMVSACSRIAPWA